MPRELDPAWRLERCKADIEAALGWLPQVGNTMSTTSPLQKLEHAQGELSRAITLLRLMGEQ